MTKHRKHHANSAKIGVTLIALISVLLTALPGAAQSNDPVYAPRGMVVSASEHASAAGAEIMKRDGNAFDAAAVTGFVLAVTFPYAGNLGGGGFMVASGGEGKTSTLDFREKAPSGASRDMYLDEDGDVIPGLSLRSPLASGVPGSVDGLLQIWQAHGSGKFSRQDILEPAIRLAEEGFALNESLSRSLNSAASRFKNDPGASKIFVRQDSRPWRPGDILVQRDLAATLKRIAEHGRDGFYEGDVAELIAEQQKTTGGLIARRDLTDYASVYRPAIQGTFQEYEIVSMGPPSSGGVLLVQMLNMLEAYSLDDLGQGTSALAHLLTEVQRRAYADRAEHLGDSDFWRVPVDRLTSKDYARERASNISMTKATPSADVSTGIAPPTESEETTHYSVVDGFGNAVAVTTTLNGGYGSGIVIDGAGFFMNNEMDDFSAKPGVPNLYGVTGGSANAIEPNKRMLSSMTPTVVLKDGEPYLVLGSPGGSTIITTVLQIFLNVAVHEMNIQEAVSAPRHHSQWMPDAITHEPDAFSSEVAEELKALGHSLRRRAGIGVANCIMITEDGVFGAPDPRRGNAAIGY